ncbi:restriction endonuclease subunit S [Aeromonas sanarellii]|nr:restriction endonuclease subunit S [Aeromonas sanarellii]
MTDANFQNGWLTLPFGEIVVNENGSRRPVSLQVRANIKGRYPYYGATGIVDSLNDYTHDGEYILIGEDGANLLSKSKKLAFTVNGKFWANNHAHVIKCIAGMPEKFIEHFINSLDLSPFITGSAQPKLTKGNLDRILCPLPPALEQKEILITHDPQPASRADMASEGLPRLHAPIQPTCS